MNALVITEYANGYTQDDICDDEGEPVLLPASWHICGRCDGDGGHGNPAFDGLSSSDEFWTDDPDWTAAYIRGDFEVTCTECNGTGKVLEIDETALEPEVLEAYYQWLQDEAESRQVEAAERRYGA